MNNAEASYCRLCVEPKFSSKIFDLDSNTILFSDLIKMLKRFSCYVDFNSRILPRTICSECYKNLTRAYVFIKKVQEAQTILTKFYSALPSKAAELAIEAKEKDLAIENKDGVESLNGDTEIDMIKCIGIVESEDNDSDSNSDMVQEFLTDKTWSSYTWLCKHCLINQTSLASLRKHSKEEHGKCFGFVCVDCPKEQDNFGEFMDHVIYHRQYLSDYCPYCNEHMTTSRKCHLRNHFRPPQELCRSCGEAFSDRAALEVHIQEYTSLSKQRTQAVTQKNNLTLAKFNPTVTLVDDLKCSVCLKIFKSKNVCREHKKIHNNNRQRNYACDMCKKAFFSKSTLQAHILIHASTKPFKCLTCDKSFVSYAKLKYHENLHKGVKPFKCHECGKQFRLKSILKTHQRSHSAFPFQCKVCKKGFKFKQNLKNHLLKHNGSNTKPKKKVPSVEEPSASRSPGDPGRAPESPGGPGRAPESPGGADHWDEAQVNSPSKKVKKKPKTNQ